MLSIVIPILNQHEMTQDCILAIRKYTSIDYELIIVDNGSDPPFQAPFMGYVPITMIRNEINEGFPKAVNQGIKASSGENIILLNNDVIVTPGAFDRLAEWLETFDIIGPMTNYSAKMQAVQAPFYGSKEALNNIAEEWAEAYEGEAIEVNWIIGFCMAFKREVYEKVGLFDESLWPCSGEEIDFCFRARKADFRIGIAGDVYVHHIGSQTFKDLEKAGQANYIEICERNHKHLAEKWGADFWENQLRYSKTAIHGETALKLNLGCGSYHMEGWVNIDQLESVNPDLLADAMDLPYEANSVDEIYCGHLVEHLSWDEGQGALRHWLDILKPGGKIRVVVPDFDILAKRYLDNPRSEKLKVLNNYFIYSYVQESPHRYFYSAGLLKEAMEMAGFKRVERLPVNHPYFVETVDWQCGFVGVKG